jgi:hypothetical protein
VYTYTVEEKDGVRILTGTTDRTDTPFVLYVTDKKVTGTVDNQHVSFALKDVKPMGGAITVLASR